MGLRIEEIEVSLDLYVRAEEMGHLLIKTEDLQQGQERTPVY
jgi:hypothetical protein